MTVPSALTSPCPTVVSPAFVTEAVTKTGSVGLYASGSVVRLEFAANPCVTRR